MDAVPTWPLAPNGSIVPGDRSHGPTNANEDENQRVADVEEITQLLAATAVERDRQGHTPKAQRDLLRRSGLLRLSTPRDLGGAQAPWTTVLQVVRRFATVDPAVAHVFGFHHLLLATARLFAQPTQWRPWLWQSAREDHFWGNALNPLDHRTRLVWDGDKGRLIGEKTFCSGALDSDRLVVSAHCDNEKLAIVVIPTQRPGISLRDDWDSFGQRQTDSGSAHFDGVEVHLNEVLAHPGPLGSTFASLRPCLAQLILVNIYVGIAQGALAAAQGFANEYGRPWFRANVSRRVDDPYVVRTAGEAYVDTESARALAEQAALAFQQAWLLGDELQPQQRGEVALTIGVAKAQASKVVLSVTSKIFELMGPRATSGRLGLDRFWRNARTHTLHDPVDYRLAEIGAWALRHELPTPSFYS